jgi:hypothetical protein
MNKKLKTILESNLELSDSNDLVDLGRAELAKELLDILSTTQPIKKTMKNRLPELQRLAERLNCQAFDDKDLCMIVVVANEGYSFENGEGQTQCTMAKDKRNAQDMVSRLPSGDIKR